MNLEFFLCTLCLFKATEVNLWRKQKRSLQPVRVQSLRTRVLALAVAVAALAAGPASAFILFDDRATFQAQLGASITDDYTNPGYDINPATGVNFLTDAEMNAVLGETIYTPTGFSNNNIVGQVVLGRNGYCAGCNGSFLLSFTSTSVGSDVGVFGVGLDLISNTGDFETGKNLYTAFVTFGDGSTANFELPFVDNEGDPSSFPFFGLTSDQLVRSIAFGLPDGEVSTEGSFAITNLTIGAEVPGPLPLIGVAAAFGASRRIRKRIKASRP